MQARSTMPFRHVVRAMCSTLPARRSDRSRFALAAKRMYRLCSNASRDLHRVFVGRFCTHYRIYPSVGMVVRWRRQPWRVRLDGVRPSRAAKSTTRNS